MQDLNFKSFRVHNGNRAAFEVCEAVATLQHPDPQPILLIGHKDAGKTHLLWAIVNHVRASKMRVGLALIMAHEFPEKVRSLVRDPSPIQGGKRAILLVDGLELFKNNSADLESVVRVFLDNGHNVVLTTTSPPADIAALEKGFVLLLESGESLDVSPPPHRDDNDDKPTASGHRDPDFAVKLLESERDRYKDELEKQAAQAHELKAKFELAIAEQSRMNVLLADSSRVEAMQEQHTNTIESLSEQLSAERSQVQSLREQLSQSIKTIESQKNSLGAAEGEAEVALAEQARLQGKLGSLSEVQQDFEQMQQERNTTALQRDTVTRERDTAIKERDTATQERDAAIEERDATVKQRDSVIKERDDAIGENRHLIDQAEALLKKIGSEQVGFTQENAAMHIKLGQLLDSINEKDCVLRPVEDFIDLEQELAETNASVQSLQEAIENLREEHDAKYSEWDDDQSQLRAKFEQSESKRICLKTSLDDAQAMSGTIEFELEKARRHSTLLLAEMDALRNEAASQVASANMQAGEMEHRISGLESALDIMRETGRAASKDIERKNKDLSDVAKELIALSSRLAVLKDSAIPSDDRQVSDTEQGILFAPTEFEVLPTIVSKTKSKHLDEPPEISADDESLRHSVEEALFADGDSEGDD